MNNVQTYFQTDTEDITMRLFAFSKVNKRYLSMIGWNSITIFTRSIITHRLAPPPPLFPFSSTTHTIVHIMLLFQCIVEIYGEKIKYGIE